KGKERYWPLVCALDSPVWHLYLKKAKAPDVMDLFDSDENGCKDTKKCHRHHPHKCTCKRRKRILKWLCQNFERMGKLIVLESLLDPLRLPWEANLVVNKPHTPLPQLAANVGDDELVVPGVEEGEMVVIPDIRCQL